MTKIKPIAEVFEEELEKRIIEGLKEVEEEYNKAWSKQSELYRSSTDSEAKEKARQEEQEWAEKFIICRKFAEKILGGKKRIYLYWDRTIEIKEEAF